MQGFNAGGVEAVVVGEEDVERGGGSAFWGRFEAIAQVLSYVCTASPVAVDRRDRNKISQEVLALGVWDGNLFWLYWRVP